MMSPCVHDIAGGLLLALLCRDVLREQVEGTYGHDPFTPITDLSNSYH